MAVSSLILHFDAQGIVPVDIAEVLSVVQKDTVDEKIEIHAVDTRPEKLRGSHYRFIIPARPASLLMPERVTRVTYSSRMSSEWQRLVCCKELIHVYDSEPIRTSKKEEVLVLGNKLTNGNAPNWGKAPNSLQTFFDELAKWQALAVMFPFGLRAALKERFDAADVTTDQIASIVELPVEYVGYVMHDAWEPLRDKILAHC